MTRRKLNFSLTILALLSVTSPATADDSSVLGFPKDQLLPPGPQVRPGGYGGNGAGALGDIPQHTYLHAPAGKEAELKILLTSWKAKCKYWHHCNGQKCHYDSSDVFDETSFEDFLLEMELKFSLTPRIYYNTGSAAALGRIRKQINRLQSSPVVRNANEETDRRWRDDRKLLESCVEKVFPSLEPFQRMRVSKMTRYFWVDPATEKKKSPGPGDFTRETEDSKIRNVLEKNSKDDQ